MLRDRLFTAALLIPLVIWGVLGLPTEIIAVVLALLVLLGGYELARLSGVQKTSLQYAYLLLLMLAMSALYPWLAESWWPTIQALMMLWWIITSISLLLRRQPIQESQQLRLGLLILGSVVLLLAWVSLARIHAIENIGPYLMLFLLVLIWSADSAAYFTGRAFGKRRLAPMVSPGKTWAGVAGATLAAVVCAIVLWQLAWLPFSWPILVLLCVLVVWLSIGGDLWQSLLKRQAGVKDSGNLLPGHGGVLDRIDSLLAASPAFAASLAWLELLA